MRDRPLRIGIVAPLWMPVPPVTYGGIERHLHVLVDELIRLGHEVVLYATGDSRTAAALRYTSDRGVAATMDRLEAHSYEHYLHATIARALRESREFDVWLINGIAGGTAR